jgi:putative heme-binding domain-containing protein
MLARLTDLAEKEEAAEVRLQLASSAQRLTKQDTLPLLQKLMGHKQDARDPFLPLMIWLAYEPRVAGHQGADAPRSPNLGWLRDNAVGNPLVTDEIVPRTMRRLATTGKADDLAACVAFLGGVKDAAVRRRALEGLTQALQNRLVDPPTGWERVRDTLLADGDKEVQRLANRLAVNFRDVQAARRALAVARDVKKPMAERLDAIRTVAVAYPPEALPPLYELLAKDPSNAIRCEVCRALAAFDDDPKKPAVPKAVLAGWKGYPLEVRAEAVNLLAGRKEWARELLNAVGTKQVPATDLHNNVIVRIHAHKDKGLDEQVRKVWGVVRDKASSEELNALITKMRGQLHQGRASFERGRKVFENQCAKCHKFDGKGSDAGPELDGAGRDIEYLLVNVLDPNRIIGQPYFKRFIVLKNGRIEDGLLHAEDGQSITLKGENNALKVIQKKDIQEMEVQEKSLMPEGLAGTMTEQDFRDLVRYLMAHPFLTEVAVAGPFPVKEVPAVTLANPLAVKGVKWEWPVVGSPGRIPLPAGAGDGEQVAFIVAEVTTPAAQRTRLQIGVAHPVQVWLNGKHVYQGKPGSGPAAPDQVSVEVDLCEGSNQLLFKVAYRGGQEALYARLLDPHRLLTHPEPKGK